MNCAEANQIDMIDFAMEFHRCNLSEALQKLSSFHQPKHQQEIALRPAFYRHENTPINTANASEATINIIAAKQPISDLWLCSYLKKIRIEMDLASKYCHEVSFTLDDKNYKAIGFENSAGGYELMNEYFKGSSSPKYVTYLDNNANNISVFEGFFDFLSYQSIHRKHD